MILQMNRNKPPATDARSGPDFDNAWTRRQFLSSAAISAASLALSAPSFGSESQAGATGPAPLRGRFVTHVSIFRVNQIELTLTRNIGEAGRRQSARNSSARVGIALLQKAGPVAR
jgi:hypothetical protein